MQVPGKISNTSSVALNWLQYVVYGSVILYFGRQVFVPISFALLISFVLYPICIWFQRRGFGKLPAIIISIFLLVMLGVLLTSLLLYQLASFLNEWPLIQSKLTATINEISLTMEDLGISKEKQSESISKVSSQLGGDFLSLLKNAITASTFSLVMLVLIPVYTLLILYYRNYWMKILGRLFPTERQESLREIILKTIQSYYNFIKGMAIVYIVVGILNSIGLLLLGVPHAILFGFIASVLTFVPYIGIMAGALLPMAMAWITYDSIWYPLGVAAIFTFVQYLEANVIFPLAVSSRLNVNTLVMLVAIFTGGIVWGMAGMILFVPFMGVAKLIADHNPNWKTASMILGTDSTNYVEKK